MRELIDRLREYAPVVRRYGLVKPHSRASLAALLDEAAAALEAAREALVADRERWGAQKAAAIREQAGGMTRGDPTAVARCDAAIQIIDAAIDQARGKENGNV